MVEGPTNLWTEKIPCFEHMRTCRVQFELSAAILGYLQLFLLLAVYAYQATVHSKNIFI